MPRKNPTVDKNAGPIPGFETRIAFPSSVQPQVMEMPDVNMSTNDGDNPSIGSAPFANGKDMRVKDRQGGADPTPSMPGA